MVLVADGVYDRAAHGGLASVRKQVDSGIARLRREHAELEKREREGG